MFEQGYATAFRVQRIPVRLHWSIALGLAYVSGLHFAPGAWLGYLVLVLVHELGHALLVRRYGAYVRTINIHGLGGECVYEGRVSEYQRNVIAWGGVLAQLVLFLAALGLRTVVPLESRHVLQFFDVLLVINLFVAAFNLLPFGPLDGKRAWRVPRMMWARRRARNKPAASTKQRKKPTGDLKLVRDENGDFHFERDD